MGRCLQHVKYNWNYGSWIRIGETHKFYRVHKDIILSKHVNNIGLKVYHHVPFYIAFTFLTKGNLQGCFGFSNWGRLNIKISSRLTGIGIPSILKTVLTLQWESLYLKRPCITVTPQWAAWPLKSPVSRLLAQPFVEMQIKENVKASCHWPLWGESTGDRGIPITKDK